MTTTMKLTLSDGSTYTLVPGTMIESLLPNQTTGETTLSIIALLPNGEGDIVWFTNSRLRRVELVQVR